MRNGFRSFWLDNTTDPSAGRPQVTEDISVDVAIVGAGYTGLWTAYWLKRKDPTIEVAVLERNTVGYGASGRNGGWLSGKMVGLRKNLVHHPGGRAAVSEMERRTRQAVSDVADLFDERGIDIDAARGGMMQIALTESELERLKHHVEMDRSWGLGADIVRMLSADETRERVKVHNVQGAAYNPYGIRINPAKLVYGLAQLCEAAGVRIYEHSGVTEIQGGTATTDRGLVGAEMVVLATEAYTTQIPGRKRAMLPMNSSMVVTTQLDDAAWEKIGWQNCELMSGAQHMYFYTQHTADGRIALGGRGIPYRFGSRPDDNGRLDARTQQQLTSTLQGLFPQVPLRFEHSWCGILGVTRDWSPFIDMDRSARLLRVGGYAGQGVTAAYIAGEAAADLVLERPTPLTESVWVRDHPRQWEMEPVRWVGAQTLYTMYRMADRIEHRRGGPETSLVGKIADKLAGR